MGILAGSKISCELSGDESLNRRPVRRVIEPLTMMGGKLSTKGGGDNPPVIVQGSSLHGLEYVSKVASAQVKSAVILAAINADGATSYSEPSNSRDHTERFLQYQGCPVSIGKECVTVRPPVTIRPFDYEVPGDISTASFFIVAASLLEGSELTIENVLLNETRTGALDILGKMGAHLVVQNKNEYNGEKVGDVTVRSTTLKGFDAAGVDIAKYIDEVPILAVAAMFAEGKSTFHNIGELRVKESDRAQGIVEMLRCYGCGAAIEGDTLTIEGGCKGELSEPTHRNDHRIAMAIEVVDLILQGAVSGNFAKIISISAPEFYSTMESCLR
jgi:3-phosphoshikimate 1-carboxyvinyltransferase